MKVHGEPTHVVRTISGVLCPLFVDVLVTSYIHVSGL